MEHPGPGQLAAAHEYIAAEMRPQLPKLQITSGIAWSSLRGTRLREATDVWLVPANWSFQARLSWLLTGLKRTRCEFSRFFTLPANGRKNLSKAG